MPHVPDEAVQVAEAFAMVERSLAAELDVQATLDKIVQLAVEYLEPCDCAGISVIERGRVISRAWSSDAPSLLNEIQSETGEGSCIDAMQEHEVFETGDLGARIGGRTSPPVPTTRRESAAWLLSRFSWSRT